jgi:hypothetical protein
MSWAKKSGILFISLDYARVPVSLLQLIEIDTLHNGKAPISTFYKGLSFGLFLTEGGGPLAKITP